MATTKVGSQTREPLEETEYRLVATWPDVHIGHVVLADEAGRRELWAQSDSFAGYVVTINGIGYEFIRSL